MSPQTRQRKAPPEGTDAWIPDDVGDQLVGVVIDVDTAWSDWLAQKAPNDPEAGWYPLLTIRRDDGREQKLHGFRTVLFSELVKREPIVGEKIVVMYLGPGEAKDGKEAPEIFRVRVEGRDPQEGKSIYRQLRGRGGRVAPSPGAPPEAAAPADAGSGPRPGGDPTGADHPLQDV